MIHATIRYEHEGEQRGYAGPMQFENAFEAQQFVDKMDRNYPHYTHTWQEVDFSVTTAADAITILNAMNDGDYPETAHSDAEEILCNVLRSIGPEYAAVASAFYEARDRVGFWYA